MLWQNASSCAALKHNIALLFLLWIDVHMCDGLMHYFAYALHERHEIARTVMLPSFYHYLHILWIKENLKYDQAVSVWLGFCAVKACVNVSRILLIGCGLSAWGSTQIWSWRRSAGETTFSWTFHPTMNEMIFNKLYWSIKTYNIKSYAHFVDTIVTLIKYFFYSVKYIIINKGGNTGFTKLTKESISCSSQNHKFTVMTTDPVQCGWWEFNTWYTVLNILISIKSY